MVRSVSAANPWATPRRDEHADVVLLLAEHERQRRPFGRRASRRSCSTTPGAAPRHVPVVGLVQVVVEADEAPACLSERLPCTISRPWGNHDRRYVSTKRPRSSPWTSGSTSQTPRMTSDSACHSRRGSGLEAAVAAPEEHQGPSRLVRRPRGRAPGRRR